MFHFQTEEDRQAYVSPHQPAPACRLLLGRGGQPRWKKHPPRSTANHTPGRWRMSPSVLGPAPPSTASGWRGGPRPVALTAPGAIWRWPGTQPGTQATLPDQPASNLQAWETMGMSSFYLFIFLIFFLIFFFNVYLFLGKRETEHERGRGRERGRHRIGNRLQALSHQPRA